MLKRRLSPQAATVVTVAAVLAALLAVSPSFAGTFLTKKKAAHVYLTNKEASSLFLKKKAAGNTFVKKIDAPDQPVVGIAAGSAVFGPVSAKTAGYIPSVFTSFATKAKVSKAVITFSGTSTCTASTAGLACPIQILVDGQPTGKTNFALSTTGSPAAQPDVHTVMLTSVLLKGGHTVAVQYAGADKVTFKLVNWNLSVEAYPEPEEAPEDTVAADASN